MAARPWPRSARPCAARAKSHGLAVVFRQTNHEGELIDWIQEARTKACGVILNAGAYTHTSVALLDALRALDRPLIEVHLSNPYAREQFRHRSFVSGAATGVICGLKETGYLLAVDALADLLKGKTHEMTDVKQIEQAKPAETPAAVDAARHPRAGRPADRDRLTEIEIEQNGMRIRVCRQTQVGPGARSGAGRGRAAERSRVQARRPCRRHRHVADGRHRLSSRRSPARRPSSRWATRSARATRC